MVLSGERIVRAEHDLAAPACPGRHEQELDRRPEVVGIPVVPLAAHAVVSALAGISRRVLEVVQARPQSRAAETAKCRRELVAEGCLARSGPPVDRNSKTPFGESADRVGYPSDESGPRGGQGLGFRLSPSGDRFERGDITNGRGGNGTMFEPLLAR